MTDIERILNERFGIGLGRTDNTNHPGQETPRLEYYQTPDGNLLIEEANGPSGAWIEIEVDGGRS